MNENGNENKLKIPPLEAGLENATPRACNYLLENRFEYVNGCPLYDCVDMIFGPIPRPQFEAYRKLLSGTGLSSYQTHSRISLFPLTPSIMNSTVQSALKELDLLSTYGCQVYTIHPPVVEFCSEVNKKSYLEAACILLQPICEHAREKRIRVALETTSATLDFLLLILSSVNRPNLGICLDTGMSYVQEDGTVDKVARRLGEMIFATHINDEEGVYFKHEHRFPGEGGIEWNGLKDALLAIKFNKPSFFELNAPLQKIRAFWNALFQGHFIPTDRPAHETVYYRRDFAEAEKIFTARFQRESDAGLKAEYGLKLAMILLKKRAYRESIEICRRIEKECKGASGTFAFEMAGLHIGKCREMLGDYQGAAECYQNYRGKDPIVALFAGPMKAAQCFYNLGHYEEAIAACAKISGNDPTYCYGLLIALACYELKGDRSGMNKITAAIKDAGEKRLPNFQHIKPSVYFRSA